MGQAKGVWLAALVLALACTPKTEGAKPTSATVDSSDGASAGLEPKLQGAAAMLKIESTAFSHQGEIPKKYTCDGSDLSPPLSWSGVPEGTKGLALIVDDPDAPDPAAPKRIWVHWVLYDIPPDSRGLDEAVKTLPSGTRDGKNDWGKTGYGGPCPPIGRHRYFHKLYALDAVLEGLKEPTKGELEQAMKGHVLAKAEIIGTYQRGK